MPRPRHVVALLPTIAFLAACQGTSTAPAQSPIERGKHLVAVSDCNICHSPKKMGPQGLEPDMSRLLSGFPHDEVPPMPATNSGPWVIHTLGSLQAWAGPWGVSFPANLTPDDETGIGAWDEKMFIAAIRTGKHLGGGRDILPPMPWRAYSEYSDEDLKAIFAYLKSVPPIKNQVPDPLPPAAAPAAPPTKG